MLVLNNLYVQNFTLDNILLWIILIITTFDNENGEALYEVKSFVPMLPRQFELHPHAIRYLLYLH